MGANISSQDDGGGTDIPSNMNADLLEFIILVLLAILAIGLIIGAMLLIWKACTDVYKRRIRNAICVEYVRNVQARNDNGPGPNGGPEQSVELPAAGRPENGARKDRPSEADIKFMTAMMLHARFLKAVKYLEYQLTQPIDFNASQIDQDERDMQQMQEIEERVMREMSFSNHKAANGDKMKQAGASGDNASYQCGCGIHNSVVCKQQQELEPEQQPAKGKTFTV